MQPMTPSKQVTQRQIDKAVANYRALLEKNASRLDSVAFQYVLGQPGLAIEQFEMLNSRVAAIGSMIMYHVKVERSYTQQEIRNHIGWSALYIDNDSLDSIPVHKGIGGVNLYFFKIGHDVSCDDLDKEYARRDLKPDPYVQAIFNKTHEDFVCDHPNVSQWKDEGGNYVCMIFHRPLKDYVVVCDHRDFGFDADMWFGGVRR